MKILFALLTILVFAVAGSAADINGKWIAQVSVPRGEKSEWIFTFQVSGENVKGNPTLTGTLKTKNQDSRAISEGTISDDTLSFVVVYKTPFGEVRVKYQGKISGDGIKFTVKQEGDVVNNSGVYPQEFVANRVP